MEERHLFSEEYLVEHGSGYYLICKRLAPEWHLESLSKEDLKAMEACSHDFDEAFQFKVVFVGTTERLEFLSEWGGKRKGSMRKYEPSVVLLVKREAGIPGEEEAEHRVCRLNETEQNRFQAREHAKGRKGGKYRGSMEYTGADLANLGVYMHRVSLRMANCWMERHGGKRRVFQESYRSFQTDEKILELLHLASRQESAAETASPTWYVQDGVIGDKAFHQSVRNLDEHALQEMENERIKIEEELLCIFEEHVTSEPLKEKARKMLSTWGTELKWDFFRAFSNWGNGTKGIEYSQEFLMNLLIGARHFGWCMSSEVVKHAYQRFKKKESLR